MEDATRIVCMNWAHTVFLQIDANLGRNADGLFIDNNGQVLVDVELGGHFRGTDFGPFTTGLGCWCRFMGQNLGGLTSVVGRSNHCLGRGKGGDNTSDNEQSSKNSEIE